MRIRFSPHARSDAQLSAPGVRSCMRLRVGPPRSRKRGGNGALFEYQPDERRSEREPQLIGTDGCDGADGWHTMLASEALDDFPRRRTNPDAGAAPPAAAPAVSPAKSLRRSTFGDGDGPRSACGDEGTRPDETRLSAAAKSGVSPRALRESDDHAFSDGASEMRREASGTSRWDPSGEQGMEEPELRRIRGGTGGED